jgi:antitoxin ParD1/3/4
MRRKTQRASRSSREQRNAQDAAKLGALRHAARVGIAALDRGEFKEFENIEDADLFE